MDGWEGGSKEGWLDITMEGRMDEWLDGRMEGRNGRKGIDDPSQILFVPYPNRNHEWMNRD